MMSKILCGMPGYYEQYGVSADQPLYLMMNLETSCSMRCPKCALPGRARCGVGRALDLSERQRLLGLAAQAGFKALVIIGAGEPSENFPLMQRIVGKASELGLDTILFSTAAKLDAEQAEFYATHRTTLIVSLDSMDPVNYCLLTGNGNLTKTLANIVLLRKAYAAHQDDDSVLRLGINTTVVRQNVHELADIKRFASDDMLFVANAPIRRGKFAPENIWRLYIGSDEDYEALVRLTAQASDTGSHSSTFRGVCGYFSRGVALDVDGTILSCGYASETAGTLGQSQDLIQSQDLLELNRSVQSRFRSFCRQTGRVPSCPLRDPEVEEFIRNMRG